MNIKSLFITGLLLFAASLLWPDDGLRQKIVETAKNYLGVPYIYGAESPQAFDCSGFVRYVYRAAAGINLPRSSRNIWSGGHAVRIAAAQPGDILVFDTTGGGASHVAILLDNNAMIHAVSDGPRTGVIVSSLHDRYFAPRLLGMRSYIASAPVPLASEPAQAHEETIEPVGLTIAGEPAVYADSIPAALGTAIQFHIKNETGRDGSFVVLFYKVDNSSSRHKIIQQFRASISAGAVVKADPVFFAEPGQYRLILKNRDDVTLIERTWQAVKL